jgi:energy-coupling factor transporter ATP-binding protein EcfA2
MPTERPEVVVSGLGKDMEFKELHFGMAAAEKEAAQEPDLLVEGYYDPHDLPSSLMKGSPFLVLGPKGSGKSTITEHLRIVGSRNSMRFVSRAELKDFPFRDFTNIKTGGSNDLSRYPGNWAWLLLLTLFASFAEDEGAHSANDPDFLETIRVLRANGFLPTPSLREAVMRSSKTTITMKLPVAQVGMEMGSTQRGLHLYSAVDVLRRLASNFCSDSRHLVAIDGLDEIFIHDEIQWDALATLILEVNRLNTMFFEHNTPAVIVVLCRTDVFERLPLADANKIRQDSGVTLNWYPDNDNPHDSPLISLANKKASVRHPGVKDVIQQFFPESMNRGGRPLPVHQYLLERTRHTPRDFLTLLKYIQRAASRSGRLRPHVVNVGIRAYCIDYFVPEVRNELVGLMSKEDARRMIGLLSTMRGHLFLLEELEAKAQTDPRYQELEVSKAIAQLFTCGAIGNTIAGRRGHHYNFSYRNPQVDFDPTQMLVMQNALRIGLNVPRTVPQATSRTRRSAMRRDGGR